MRAKSLEDQLNRYHCRRIGALIWRFRNDVEALTNTSADGICTVSIASGMVRAIKNICNSIKVSDIHYTIRSFQTIPEMTQCASFLIAYLVDWIDETYLIDYHGDRMIPVREEALSVISTLFFNSDYVI
jgi:hypothetical protein